MIGVIGESVIQTKESIAEKCAQVAIEYFKERESALSMSGVVNRKKKSKCDYCDDSGAMPFSSTKKCPLCQ